MFGGFDHFVDEAAGDGFAAVGGGDFGVVDHTAVGCIAVVALADLNSVIRSVIPSDITTLWFSLIDVIDITILRSSLIDDIDVTVCKTRAYIRHTPALILMDFHDDVMRIYTGQRPGWTG